MTTRKKVLSSALFFASGMLCMAGILNHSIGNLISSACSVVIAVIYIK
jgi:hypothetical protein